MHSEDLIVLAAFIIAIAYLVAWFFATQIITGIATDKGYNMNGRLWFIGFFHLVAVAVIVAALPNRKQDSIPAPASSAAPANLSSSDELPSI